MTPFAVDPSLLPWFIVGIVFWMTVVICVGYFGSRGRSGGEKFVTGGSDMNSFLVFCTLGATIIGTGSTIGAISDGFEHAWGGALFGTGSAIGLLLLSLFSPVREKGFITMSEEAQYYYGGKRIVRQVMGFTMFAAEIIWLGNHITGGATYLSFVCGISPIWCKLISALAFGAYVFIGGYVAVVKADVLQFCASVLGFALIAWKAIPLAGGYGEIANVFAQAGKPGAMGFYGLGSYGVMAGISLVLAMVMSVLGCPGNRTRIYTARDGKVARKAFLAQGGMMFGWSIVTAIIGMSCFAIATHNGHTLATPNHAFPYMATQVMAPSIGLMFLICGLSAAVSSGGSSSISGVTILLTDVYPMLTGKSIPKEKYAFVSRIALLAALAIAFSITIFVTDMIDYIQKAVGAFLPGAAVAMIAGRFWKRATWQGALASVGCGTTLGLAIVLIPCVSAWVKSVFGGPAIPAVAVSALGVIAGSLLSPKDETPDEVRVASVMASRAGRVL